MLKLIQVIPDGRPLFKGLSAPDLLSLVRRDIPKLKQTLTAISCPDFLITDYIRTLKSFLKFNMQDFKLLSRY